MLDLFQWIGHSSLGAVLRQSTWAFAAIEVVHLLALAIFGGAILLVDLRFFRIGLNSEPTGKVARELSPQLFGSLIVMAITGVLMVVSGPMRYYYNEAFRIKMALFVLGVAAQFLIHKIAAKTEFDTSWWRRIAAGLSLTIWTGVALAGRAIGYI